MIVAAKYSDCQDISDVEKYGYFKESVLEITKGKLYMVHAIVTYEGVTMLQIVNDIEYPDWLPAAFFSIEETRIPEDWICNILNDEPSFLLGPSFIAENQSAYTSMVELEPNQVKSFWERIKLFE